jgi:di/tripeptidase
MSLDMDIIGLDLQSNFIKYCEDYDTGSVDNGGKVVPSTDGQRVFAEFLAEQAQAMGYETFLAEKGENSFGLKISVKSNITDREVMPIALGAHLDAAGNAEKVANSGVEVVVHENYDGSDIHLENDVVIGQDQFSGLERYVGDTLYTSNGKTLLKGDDVAGITSIMGLLKYFSDNPDVEHGDVDIILTYDEEQGLYGGFLLDMLKDTNAEAMMILDNEDGKLGIDTFNAANAVTPLQIDVLENDVSGEKYKINIAGQTSFPGHGKEEGLVDAYRTLPAVYSILKSLGASIVSVGGEGHSGIELEVIVDNGTDLSALSEIIDERFREHGIEKIRKYADAPVTYEKVDETATTGFVYNLSQFVAFVEGIPNELTAEQSEGDQPYLQPWVFVPKDDGNSEVGVYSLLRAFETDQLDNLKQRVRDAVPESEITDDYFNMRDKLQEEAPWLITEAEAAMQKAFEATGYTGEVLMNETRGGTEASAYTLNAKRSLPTVNVGVMGGGFHNPCEFTGKSGMLRGFLSALYFTEAMAQRDYTPAQAPGPK